MFGARQVIAFEWLGRPITTSTALVMHSQSRMVWTRSGPAGDDQPAYLARRHPA